MTVLDSITPWGCMAFLGPKCFALAKDELPVLNFGGVALSCETGSAEICTGIWCFRAGSIMVHVCIRNCHRTQSGGSKFGCSRLVYGGCSVKLRSFDFRVVAFGNCAKVSKTLQFHRPPTRQQVCVRALLTFFGQRLIIMRRLISCFAMLHIETSAYNSKPATRAG